MSAEKPKIEDSALQGVQLKKTQTKESHITTTEPLQADALKGVQLKKTQTKEVHITTTEPLQADALKGVQLKKCETKESSNLPITEEGK